MSALAIAFMTTAACAAESDAALVKRVSGSVKVMRQGAAINAAGGMPLRVSDRVVTAPAASAALAFKDGTLLTLAGEADVLVSEYIFEPARSAYAFSLYMSKGAAIYESGKIGKLSPDAVKISTPKATVSVRGTRFLIEAN